MTGRWRVEVSPPARRQLQRLPPRVLPAVVEFIAEILAREPLRVSKPLSGDMEGLRGARRGDYRVLVEVDEATSLVVVIRIAHRAHAYRPVR